MASLLDRWFAASSTPSGRRTQRIRDRSHEAVEERGDEDDEPGQRRQNDKANDHGALLAPSARGLGHMRLGGGHWPKLFARRALGAGLMHGLRAGRGRRRCYNRKPGGGAVHAARSASIARRGERRSAPPPASQTKAAPRAGAKTASAGALA